MEPVLASCRVVLSVVQALIDAVLVRDNLYLGRPEFAKAAVAGRLAKGLVAVEAYLRRVLLVMALELEHNLKDTRGPMKRPHGRKAKNAGNKPRRFMILSSLFAPHPDDALYALHQRQALRIKPENRGAPQPVAMARLYQRLDTVIAISKDPMARAKRLAFYLARNREGPIMAPNHMWRPPSFWRTDARATFDALAHTIVTRSKARPPPLPPIRNHYPMITRLP
jgi:hypothetical protein